MQSRSSLSILFWIINARAKNGKAPLSIRITVQGARAEISASRDVNVNLWDSKGQQLTGRTPEAKELNNYISITRNKLLSCELNLSLKGQSITAESLKNEYLGILPKRKTLSEAFLFKLNKLKEEVKVEKASQATVEKYDDLFNHVKAFIKLTWQRSDRYLDEIDYPFICDLEFYLSVTKNLSQNTSMKYISMMKTIIRLSHNRGWVATNAIAGFTCSFIYKEPLRLEMHELKTIYEKKFSNPRLEIPRDIYVFMCFTGFAYIDTFQLTKENVYWGIDKQKWISKDRQKTDGTESVPLLEIPLQILDKYKDHPLCINTGKLLPVKSNQKFNEYLKEIAAVCGINKELSTHSGRHTFATSVTLENDVPLETVGKMLGHRSIKSTQRYARVTKKKISNNMNELRNKLENFAGTDSSHTKTKSTGR